MKLKSKLSALTTIVLYEKAIWPTNKYIYTNKNGDEQYLGHLHVPHTVEKLHCAFLENEARLVQNQEVR